MAQSGNIGSILTRNDIIQQMYKKAGILSEGETLTAEQVTDGQNILNAIIYEYINKNLKIWKRKFATLFLEGGVNKYTLGSTARCTESYIETTIDGDFLSAVSVIDVTSATGMTSGDQLGIMVGNDLYWYEIDSINVNEVTLTTALGVDVDDESKVFTYTETIDKPLHIDKAMVKNLLSSSESIMPVYSREEYFELSNKSSQGIPYNIYSDRGLETMDVFIYTTPQDSSHTVELNLTSPLFITDSPADQMDFPREYTQILIYSGGYQLGVENGVGVETLMELKLERDKLFNEAAAYDSEEVSIYLSPAVSDR